ncbi:MAG: hypothetical protein AAF282_20370 [Cyanobacteria bacterium P01_A01_bin.15]
MSNLSKAYSKAFSFLAKSKLLLFEDPNFFWMQYLARFEFVREWRTRQNFLNSKDIDKSTASSNRISLSDNLDKIHKTLRKDGYYQGLTLKPDTLKSLLNFAYKNPCYGDRDSSIEFKFDEREQVELALGRSIKLASYFDTHESCEVFQDLKHDSLIREIAAKYLGHEPRYHRGELMWSFPRIATHKEKISLAQVLHCDINDYKTLKFFFYLTDVDLESGPHVYMRGSHRNRSLWHQAIGQSIASISDQALIKRYGTNNVVTSLGQAGFGLVGDPYVLHRGTTPSRCPRLLLQLEFGINTYKTWYFSTPS